MRPHATFRRAIGFTLIELMVVLVIVGLTSSLVTLHFFPDPRKQLAQESNRLGLILSHASEYASTHGTSVAFDFDASGYVFYTQDPLSREWHVLENDTVLRQRQWSDEIRPVSMRVNQNATSVHRFVFSSSGLHPDFTLTLELDGLKASIHGNMLGQIDASQMSASQNHSS